jgi:tetratricopeptide (TPR) repeat protein
VARAPEYAWPYVWRALAYAQLEGRATAQGKTSLAGEAETLREDAEHYFASAEEDYRHAIELLSKKPDNVLRWVILVNRSLLFIEHGTWDRARADLEAAIRLDGHRAEAFVNLSLFYQLQNQPDAAFEQISKAIALAPGWAALYRARADLNITRKDQKPAHRAAALNDLEQAIRLEAATNPVLALDHVNRAKTAPGRSAAAGRPCRLR